MDSPTCPSIGVLACQSNEIIYIGRAPNFLHNNPVHLYWTAVMACGIDSKHIKTSVKLCWIINKLQYCAHVFTCHQQFTFFYKK